MTNLNKRLLKYDWKNNRKLVQYVIDLITEVNQLSMPYCECTNGKCECECAACYKNGHYRFCSEKGCPNQRLGQGFVFGDYYYCDNHKPEGFDEEYHEDSDDVYWTVWNEDDLIHLNDNLRFQRCGNTCVCHIIDIHNTPELIELFSIPKPMNFPLLNLYEYIEKKWPDEQSGGSLSS